MSRLKLYEDFDFKDEDFDFEEEDENPDKSEIPDLEFVKFLKDNNCHDDFIKFFNKHLNSRGRKYHNHKSLYDYIKKNSRNQFIVDAFDWDDDSEDGDFWENLDEKWSDNLSNDYEENFKP